MTAEFYGGPFDGESLTSKRLSKRVVGKSLFGGPPHHYVLVQTGQSVYYAYSGQYLSAQVKGGGRRE